MKPPANGRNGVTWKVVAWGSLTVLTMVGCWSCDYTARKMAAYDVELLKCDARHDAHEVSIAVIATQLGHITEGIVRIEKRLDEGAKRRPTG